MASPITVWTTPVVAITRNRKRSSVRFQNVGATILYFTRQLEGETNIPSPTHFDFKLESWEVNEAIIETKSTSQFLVVSSATSWSLAVFETIKASIV